MVVLTRCIPITCADNSLPPNNHPQDLFMATINQTKIVKYFTKFACERVNVKLHIFAGKHTLLRDLGCFGIGAPLIGEKLLCRKQLTVGVEIRKPCPIGARGNLCEPSRMT